MANQSTVDTRQFSAVCQQLAQLSARPLATVVKAEVAKVLEQCIRLTPKANRSAVKRQVDFRNRSLWDNGDPKYPKKRGHQIGYITKSGVQWFADQPGNPSSARGRRMGTRVFYDMNGFFHWSGPRWQRWQANLALMARKQLDVQMILRSVGLAKESWYQIARQLGIEGEVKAPNYVKNAAASNGRIYINGTGTIIDTPQKFLINGTNSNPSVVTRMNGETILATALLGRVKYFEKSAALGVFSSMKKIAARYKGLKIQMA